MSNVGARVKSFIDSAAGLVPQGMQGGASQLGGSVSRGIAAAANPVAAGLENIGMKGVGQAVRAGAAKTAALKANTLPSYSNLTGSRILGYAGAAAGLGGAFVGGMGATSGMNALASYYTQDPMARRQDVGTVGSSPMPQDLQTGYISLNGFGSPLGQMNIGNVGNMKQAQATQRYAPNVMLMAMGKAPANDQQML
jgi:hypothetical protein